MIVVSKKDLLTPYENYEKAHRIEQTREDIPKSYLGTSPSKYYKAIDMNLEKLKARVDRMFRKFSLKNPR